MFNSRSASIGESLIGMKIQECEEAGMSFEEVVSTVEHYIEGQHTFFILENLDTLRKNGRLSKVKALVASALKINRSWVLRMMEISASWIRQEA